MSDPRRNVSEQQERLEFDVANAEDFTVEPESNRGPSISDDNEPPADQLVNPDDAGDFVDTEPEAVADDLGPYHRRSAEEQAMRIDPDADR